MTTEERELAELDAKYHDHLPPGRNCHLCGIEHAAINPTAPCASEDCDYLYEEHVNPDMAGHRFVPLDEP